MASITLATTNHGKVQSLQAGLKSFGIEVEHVELELPESRSYDLRTVAKEKVMYAFKHIHRPTVAIDSGFYIKALNGFPRNYVYFSLETIGIPGVLKLLEGQDRTCEFRSCLAFFDDKNTEPHYFDSHTPGTIALEARGTLQHYHWSPYAVLFIPAGETQTIAEMTQAQYEAWQKTKFPSSYVSKFGAWYCKYCKISAPSQT